MVLRMDGAQAPAVRQTALARQGFLGRPTHSRWSCEWMGHRHLRCGRLRLRARDVWGIPPIRDGAANGWGTGTCGAAYCACAPGMFGASHPFAMVLRMDGAQAPAVPQTALARKGFL